MVVLEAMSHRLPVFVTDVGDLPWLVRNGEEGRVVPYGDTKGMSDALINALRILISLRKWEKEHMHGWYPFLINMILIKSFKHGAVC